MTVTKRRLAVEDRRQKGSPRTVRYRVRATYDGFDVVRERQIVARVGTSAGSGFDMQTGLRDHEWFFKTPKQARDAALKLRGLPWLTVVLDPELELS